MNDPGMLSVLQKRINVHPPLRPLATGLDPWAMASRSGFVLCFASPGPRTKQPSPSVPKSKACI
jgi:hypothetical protein